MQKIKAFVARSFSPEDNAKIRPILNHLDSFRRLGFLWETAEQAEVERVSVKVRRMIDDSDIFVGIITKRHQVYRVGKGIKGVFKRALSRQAHLWTAPPWVLQECGYALKAGKKPILLCEPEIEAFGLQGDLEYIPFGPENPAATLDKLTQMITGLIAESAGVHVETVVTAQPVEPQQEIAAEPQESQQPEMPLMAQRYFEMMKAAGARDLAGMDRVYRSGLQIIQGGETDTSAIFWECVYQAMCFRAGREEALESLRKLELKHPDHPKPPDWIATCLLQFGEFDEASKKLTHAAALAGNGENATLLLRSADALKQAKKYEDARDLVLQKLLHKNVVSSVRLEALRLLYEILKLLDEKHEAFAVAEYALRQNPGDDTLRFTLGLDYLTAFSFYRFQLRKKEEEYTTIIKALKFDDSEAAASLLGLRNEYSAIDYALPVAFAAVLYALGTTALFLGSKLKIAEAPSILLSARISFMNYRRQPSE